MDYPQDDRNSSRSRVPNVSRFGNVDGVQPPALSTDQAGWKGLYADLFKLDDLPRTDAFAFTDVFVGHLHQGLAEVEIGGPDWTHSFRPGGLAIFPAGLRLAANLSDAECTMTYLQPQVLAPDEFGDTSRTEIIPQTDPPDPQLRRLMMCLHDELEAGLPSGRLFGESIGTAMLAHILGRYAVRPVTQREAVGGLANWQLRRATELMDSFQGGEVSLGLLAREVKLSPWYFCRAFKQSTGMPPHRWMQERRIAKAKELLKNSTCRLADVASELGFCNLGHFSTAFKNSTGVSPREFRRRL